MAPIRNVGKVFPTAEGFLDYLYTVGKPSWMKFITAHHTGAPTLKNWQDWQTRKNPVSDHQWLTNLAAYYGNSLGWSSGPQFFFTPKNFCVLSPPERVGVHAKSFNGMSWGVEMVGNFDVEEMPAGLRDWYVTGLACLHIATGLSPRPYSYRIKGLHFHRDDPLTTKTCPGKKIDKQPFAKEIEAKIAEMIGKEAPAERIEVTPQSQQPPSRSGTVNVPNDTLNVRTQASGKAPTIGKLAHGAAVSIIGEAMNGPTKWFKVDLPGDGDGWVSAAFVRVA